MDIKVHNIGGYVVKNYLLETPAGIIAMDTGYPGGADKFVKRFTKRWPFMGQNAVASSGKDISVARYTLPA